jgi:anti-sigma factor RsiW
MIEYQDQLKLQSYLDGELSEAESRQIAERQAQDSEAAALLTELRQTGEALAGFEQDLKLPESREFYWSKISREIQRQEAAAPQPVERLPWSVRFRRFLMPATGLALATLLAVVVSKESGSGSDSSAETALEDSGAFTYHDYTAGATLVWLSYPADNEGTDNDDLNLE